MPHTPNRNRNIVPVRRERGAQPGNQNARKPVQNTPIPADIAELLDLEVKLLSRLMARLDEQCTEELTPEENRHMVRTISLAGIATLRILRARQLQSVADQDDFRTHLNTALDELHFELNAENSLRESSLPNPFAL